VVFVAIGMNRPEWNEYKKKHVGDAFIVDVAYVTGIIKYSYFNLCDVLILPSTTDNFPLVFWKLGNLKNLYSHTIIILCVS